MFGWGENRDDEKYGEKNIMKNNIFYCLVEERKQERQKIGGEIFPLGPPLLSSQFGRKMKRKKY